MCADRLCAIALFYVSRNELDISRVSYLEMEGIAVGMLGRLPNARSLDSLLFVNSCDVRS